MQNFLFPKIERGLPGRPELQRRLLTLFKGYEVRTHGKTRAEHAELRAVLCELASKVVKQGWTEELQDEYFSLQRDALLQILRNESRTSTGYRKAQFLAAQVLSVPLLVEGVTQPADLDCWEEMVFADPGLPGPVQETDATTRPSEIGPSVPQQADLAGGNPMA